MEEFQTGWNILCLSTTIAVDLTQATGCESRDTHVPWLSFHFSVHSSRFTFLRYVHPFDRYKGNKKPWDCSLLPVPTVEEISSPVLSYLILNEADLLCKWAYCGLAQSRKW